MAMEMKMAIRKVETVAVAVAVAVAVETMGKKRSQANDVIQTPARAVIMSSCTFQSRTLWVDR
jgi:hypothetical protein